LDTVEAGIPLFNPRQLSSLISRSGSCTEIRFPAFAHITFLPSLFAPYVDTYAGSTGAKNGILHKYRNLLQKLFSRSKIRIQNQPC
jgi:hypothetical protein